MVMLRSRDLNFVVNALQDLSPIRYILFALNVLPELSLILQEPCAHLVGPETTLFWEQCPAGHASLDHIIPTKKVGAVLLVVPGITVMKEGQQARQVVWNAQASFFALILIPKIQFLAQRIIIVQKVQRKHRNAWLCLRALKDRIHVLLSCHFIF